MLSRFTKNVTGSLAGLTLILLSGCGGDPGTTGLMGEYIPRVHQTVSNHVDISHNPNQSIGTQLALDIRVIQVQNDKVFGAAFDLAFDPTIIRFVELRRGGFLESTSKNGVTYNASVQEGTVNDLVIGISQTGDDPGVTGSGILATVVFEVLNRGCSDFKFVVTDNSGVERSKLLNAPSDPNLIPQSIQGVTWSPGGIIRVRIEGDNQECVPDPQNP